jgi:hypothetical protein
MFWHWQNDSDGLPDDDHKRCIAAPGVRQLLYRGRRFEMTTVVCARVPRLAKVPVSGSRALLQMEQVGPDAGQCLVARFWRSQPFDSRSHGGIAQYGAGLDLLAAVAVELAAA